MCFLPAVPPVNVYGNSRCGGGAQSGAAPSDPDFTTMLAGVLNKAA